jgi:hypothetical protein
MAGKGHPVLCHRPNLQGERVDSPLAGVYTGLVRDVLEAPPLGIRLRPLRPVGSSVAGSGGVDCLAQLETRLAHDGGLIVTNLEFKVMRFSARHMFYASI